MARTDSDGNGEIGFSPGELEVIARQMLAAAKQAKDDDVLAISISHGVSENTANVNIRPHRTRMTQKPLMLVLLPLGHNALL
jgi:hypothetical protein